jgi:hypothetical protein
VPRQRPDVHVPNPFLKLEKAMIIRSLPNPKPGVFEFPFTFHVICDSCGRAIDEGATATMLVLERGPADVRVVHAACSGKSVNASSYRGVPFHGVQLFHD